MRRRQIRAALFLAVMGASGLIGYFVVQRVVARRIQDVANLGEKLKAEVAQQMRNFKRIKVESGRTVWEIEADEAQYLTDQKEVLVRGPKVTVHLEDGSRRAVIAGTEGRITLEGSEVKHVSLEGRVTVRLDDFELTTDVATYDQARDVVHAPGLVRMTSPSLDMTAQGMEVEVRPQIVRLLDGVETVLRNADAS